jgi:hypothetical protein
MLALEFVLEYVLSTAKRVLVVRNGRLAKKIEFWEDGGNIAEHIYH